MTSVISHNPGKYGKLQKFQVFKSCSERPQNDTLEAHRKRWMIFQAGQRMQRSPPSIPFNLAGLYKIMNERTRTGSFNDCIFRADKLRTICLHTQHMIAITNRMLCGTTRTRPFRCSRRLNGRIVARCTAISRFRLMMVVKRWIDKSALLWEKWKFMDGWDS